MADTIVIVPCFNEEQRLDLRRLKEFGDTVQDVKICFVDDGSTDRTLEMLTEIRNYNPRAFEVFSLKRNQGKAAAVRKGILRALKAQPDYVGFWDADLSTPLNAIFTFRELLRQRQQIDMVFGSRVKLLGRRIERSELRHYLGRIFATSVSFMLRLPIYDTQCGAKLFRVTPHLPALFEDRFHTRWFFDVEIIARHMALAEGNGARPASEDAIYEFPLVRWVNVKASKVGVSTYSRAGFDLMTIFFRYKLYRRFFSGRGQAS